MSYIIVQIEDPFNIEEVSIMPDETGKKVNKFNSFKEAKDFLEQVGLEDELDYYVKIVRLQ